MSIGKCQRCGQPAFTASTDAPPPPLCAACIAEWGAAVELVITVIGRPLTPREHQRLDTFLDANAEDTTRLSDALTD